MRFSTSLFATAALIAGLWACDDATGPSPQISSTLNGLVHLDGPIAGAELQLVTLFSRDGGELLTSEGQTDENGSFTLDTRGARGPFRLVVMPPGRADTLTHYIDEFPDRDALRNTDIIVTPVTMLTAALTDYYFESAIAQSQLDSTSIDHKAAFSVALTEAAAPLNAHFLGADHAFARPIRLSSNPSDRLDEPSTLTGLALDGLTELARIKAQSAGFGLEGVFTIDLLLEGLVNDLRHDGLFDGQGPNGPVLILNQFLDSHTLRRDYALALLRFAQSDRNLSNFGRADVRRYADACAASQAVIFPPDIDSQLETDPPIVSVTPKDGSVVAGIVFTEITTSDAHRIDRVEQSSAPADFEWRPVDGPPDEFRGEEGLWYRFDYRFADTTVHPDGTYTVTAVGVDELDNATREEVRWIVDNTAPTVTIEAPSNAAILSGEEREIIARAIDTNGLAHFELTTPDGVIHRADIPEPGEDVVSPTEAEIRVTYNSQREVDGVYAVTATAEDVVRNQASDAIEVQVDNAAPTITFRSPRDGAEVNGLINIVVEAEDAAPINAFVVTTPDAVEHPIERGADGTWRAQVDWDSTTVRDGPGYPITATVTDSQGNQGVATIHVEVNNVDEGIATGIAHFDSPVAGLIVEAWTISTPPERVDLCAQARDGQCVTDEDGNFEMEIADNYQGPVLLKAIADQNAFAEYIDAATGNVAGINDFDLRTLIVDYQPGGLYEGLVFSAASTLTCDWLLATLIEDGDIAAQARAAIAAWGQHLCPVGPNEDPCDPMSTRPQRYDGTDEEFVAQSSGALLGLVQAGLARRAADLRLRHDEPEFWAIGLLKRFRRDMEDGVLDGKRYEELIQVDNHPRDHRYLNACSLRSGLAAGMGSLLNQARLLDIDVAARNATEIIKEDMAVYLEGISTRVDRNIWGPIFVGGRLVWDYCEYDAGGPSIVAAQPANGELYGPNGGADTADWSLLVRATAQDDSGIGEMWLSSGDPRLEPVFDAFNTSHENFVVRVDYDDLPEGEMPLVLSATDLAGNTETRQLNPIVDRTPPEVTVFTTAIDRFDPITGEVVYRLDDPVETSADEPIFTASDGIVMGIASNEPITIFGTDASNVRSALLGFRYFVTFPLNPGIDRLALTIADAQGNTTRQDIWVLRDDEGPSIDLVDSGHYQPEDTLDWHGADCGAGNCRRVDFDFDAPSQIDPDELQQGVRGVPHRFVKIHENWNGEITGRANQPTLNFEWADELGEDVSIDYRVFAGQAGPEGACCNDVRFEQIAGWRPLDVGNREARLGVRPETIDPQLGLDSNVVYRVEARITNRADISATTSAIFSIRLIAPPIIARLDAESWRENGAGIGSLEFSNPLELTEICDAASAPQRRLSNLHVYNPWPYPIRVSARGLATVDQFNRKAWLLERRNVSRPRCLAEIGTYRTAGNNERCYDAPEQIANVIDSRRRVHSERTTLIPAVTANDVALARDGDWYILDAHQSALVSLQMPACNIPFLPGDPTLPRPRRPRLAIAHPDDRRTLEIDRSHPITPNNAGSPGLFDRYRPYERVSRLRFSVSNMRLRLSPPIDVPGFVVWHEQWTDSYEIDNPSVSLPEGLEGDD